MDNFEAIMSLQADVNDPAVLKAISEAADAFIAAMQKSGVAWQWVGFERRCISHEMVIQPQAKP